MSREAVESPTEADMRRNLAEAMRRATADRLAVEKDFEIKDGHDTVLDRWEVINHSRLLDREAAIRRARFAEGLLRRLAAALEGQDDVYAVANAAVAHLASLEGKG